MATVQVTDETFAATVEKDGIVLIDFWAEWCGPCRMFAPVFEAASEQHAEVTFAKLDTEANPEVAGRLDIQAIPTLMAFRDGVMVYREAGAKNAAGLEQLIQTLGSDELGQQVAQAKQASQS